MLLKSNNLLSTGIVIICVIFSSHQINTKNKVKYTPEWASLDKRQIPEWYDKAKIGIFIHWGVWSVPSAGFPESAFLWYYINQNQPDALDYMKKNYPPNFKYPDFASDFKAEFYDPEKWLNIFNSSGAKYIVYVAKHHEGYPLWPSSYSFNWNSMDVGPKKDLVGELFNVVREKSSLKIGVYYSLFEFYNTLYLSDKSANYTKDEFVQRKMLPELKDLVMKYKPDMIWSDGDWDTDSNYFKSKEFLAWLYTDSPVADTVVVNDRWGTDASCKHGDVNTCTDRFHPNELQERKWENAMTLDLHSWGFRHNLPLNDVIKIEKLLEQIITTVSLGGNILINIGPTSQGTIPVIFEERLKQMGDWLSINGEAIYETVPWLVQNDTFNANQVWYTCRITNLGFDQNLLELYALSLKWPALLKSYDDSRFTISLNISAECNKVNYVSFLGYNQKNVTKNEMHSRVKNELNFSCIQDDPYVILVDVSNLNPIYSDSSYAWTFKVYLIF